MGKALAEIRNLLIVGGGLSGQSAVHFAQRNDLCYALTDTRVSFDPTPFFDCWLTMKQACEHISTFSHILVSPGVDWQHPLLVMARKAGLQVWGDIEYFSQFNHKPVIAVTGTNGKSTVTAWIGHMLNQAGVRAVIGGNFGVPALDLLKHDCDVIVLELSSFQIEAMHSLKPNISVLLTISNDHLDRHGSMACYRAIKQKLVRQSQRAVVIQGEELVDHKYQTVFGPDVPSPLMPFGLVVKSGEKYLAHYEKGTFLPCSQLPMVGMHNYTNALAIWAVADLWGIDSESLRAGMCNFLPLPHRCTVILDKQGVRWVNDSKATNVSAVQAALSTFNAPDVILIMGGQAKGQDFIQLAPDIQRSVRQLIILGQDADQLMQQLGSNVASRIVSSLEEAVAFAHQLAIPSNWVLLSPGCASLDMFANYAERGKRFEHLVHSIAQ